MEFKDIVKDTLNLLQTDSIFRKKYEEYVEGMSYASISERIKYDDALSADFLFLYSLSRQFHNMSVGSASHYLILLSSWLTFFM